MVFGAAKLSDGSDSFGAIFAVEILFQRDLMVAKKSLKRAKKG